MLTLAFFLNCSEREKKEWVETRPDRFSRCQPDNATAGSGNSQRKKSQPSTTKQGGAYSARTEEKRAEARTENIRLAWSARRNLSAFGRSGAFLAQTLIPCPSCTAKSCAQCASGIFQSRRSSYAWGTVACGNENKNQTNEAYQSAKRIWQTTPRDDEALRQTDGWTGHRHVAFWPKRNDRRAVEEGQRDGARDNNKTGGWGHTSTMVEYNEPETSGNSSAARTGPRRKAKPCLPFQLGTSERGWRPPLFPYRTRPLVFPAVRPGF